MFLGTAVYTFEGVAMVIPIRNSMTHPEQLPRLLTQCVLVVMGLLITFGVIGFIAFGTIHYLKWPPIFPIFSQTLD